MIICFLFLVASSVEAQVCQQNSTAIRVKDKLKCLIPALPFSNSLAIENCANNDGELIIIENKIELKEIIQALNLYGFYGIWVSLHSI